MALKVEVTLPEILDSSFFLSHRLSIYYTGIRINRVKSLNTYTGEVTLYLENDPFQRKELCTKWDLSLVKIELK